MASTQKAYPNSDGSASGNFPATARQIRLCPWPRRNTLRRVISEWMVQVHRITPELADYHVSRMDFSELRLRVRMYAGMEFSENFHPTLDAVDAVSYSQVVVLAGEPGIGSALPASEVEV